MSVQEPAWRFPEKDGFSRIAPEHRMAVVHSLPGMIVWPILLFVLFIAFSAVVGATWQMFSLDRDPALLNTVIYTASAAAYASLAANEAEKAALINILHVTSIGSFGRLFLGGAERDIKTAAAAVEEVLTHAPGRPHPIDMKKE